MKPLVLHVVEDAPHEVALIAHRRRILAANALSRREKARCCKILFGKAVRSKLVGFDLQRLRKFFDPLPQLLILFVGNDCHAATFPVLGRCLRMCSSRCSAKCRTTGTYNAVARQMVGFVVVRRKPIIVG